MIRKSHKPTGNTNDKKSLVKKHRSYNEKRKRRKLVRRVRFPPKEGRKHVYGLRLSTLHCCLQKNKKTKTLQGIDDTCPGFKTPYTSFRLSDFVACKLLTRVPIQ